ncbi:autotransporter domain-containing protein [Herbaspirillum sp. alder98]|uniref:autotransporter outer membrane beta-barrel domain-containing protein n=1 Tax=Herbaspirillum sp. alder98 TaxID=2913096 RepID=UPI001CD85A4C|nr:autotransporter outer membrane beta-barrel domain-containing protein [Herbaspirillum sp. alder98]MCA1323389.1 autotransporter domain-containing protein [Herbaspirillum sp. alder98]
MTLKKHYSGSNKLNHIRTSSSHPSRRKINHPGQMSLLCIALGAALAAMMPAQGVAQQVTIDSSNSYNSTYTLSGGDLKITNTGYIASASGQAISVGTNAVGTFDNAGSISAVSLGLSFSGLSSIGTFLNSGRIYGGSAAMEIHGNIGTLRNTGIITGGIVGAYVTSDGTVASLTNAVGGTLNGNYGFLNEGAVGTLVNQGVINGALYGIFTPAGTISTLTNSGTITGVLAGISSGAKIIDLSNSGLIRATGTSSISAGLGNTSSGTITALSNSGTITGVALGMSNDGRIDTLTNSGLITVTGTLGSSAAISNGSTGTIGSLQINGGTISGYNGISNLGSIGTLSNSGVLSGSVNALSLGASGSLGTFTNSGLVAGNVTNLSSNALTINGGTGTTFGTLTGSTGGITSGAMGSIVSTSANLVFGSGNLLLNDNINVGTNTVNNVGSTLQLNNRGTITGNYNQGAAATLLIGVNDGATATGRASDTGYGYLVVQGNSTIASGSTIGLTKTNSYAFANGQKYVVLITTGTANYTASSLNYSLTGFTVTGANVADGGNTNLVLTLGNTGTGSTAGNTSTGSTAVNIRASTSNAQSVLTKLFSYNGANVNLLNVFNAAAALGSTAAANNAGAQLSPTANTVAATQSSAAATTQVLGIVAAHVDGLRVAQARGDSGISTGEAMNNWAVWGQAFGGAAHQGMRDNVSGFRSSYTGLVLGADRLVSERWRAGALLSYASNSISGRDDNTGSSSHVNSTGLMGYGGYAADDWYVDLAAGAIQHKYDSTRVIDFTGFSGAANGRFNGLQYATSVQAGMPIKLGGAWARTTVTPIAGLGYSITRQSGYAETGGNGAALNVNGSKISSLKSELGVKLERSFTTAFGEVVPAAQIGWRHEFHDRALQSVSSFAADSTGATSFTSTGVAPARDSGVLALSATLLRQNNLTLVARYTLEAGSGYRGQTGDVRLRYQF